MGTAGLWAGAGLLAASFAVAVARDGVAYGLAQVATVLGGLAALRLLQRRRLQRQTARRLVREVESWLRTHP